MNDMKENVGLYTLGRSNQRSGQNLVNREILVGLMLRHDAEHTSERLPPIQPSRY